MHNNQHITTDVDTQLRVKSHKYSAFKCELFNGHFCLRFVFVFVSPHKILRIYLEYFQWNNLLCSTQFEGNWRRKKWRWWFRKIIQNHVMTIRFFMEQSATWILITAQNNITFKSRLNDDTTQCFFLFLFSFVVCYSEITAEKNPQKLWTNFQSTNIMETHKQRTVLFIVFDTRQLSAFIIAIIVQLCFFVEGRGFFFSFPFDSVSFHCERTPYANQIITLYLSN